jgi:enoyl-[acyl-carrier protein] reductase II
MDNRICALFKIDKPIIQAGMIWCSGWKLAAAVSNAGGLGIIGAGSMYPEVLEEHIIKVKAALGDKPYAVNLPMLYPQIEELISIILKHKVPIVFTSAGNPKTWTAKLKGEGITVVHVVSSLKFALKAEAAGVVLRLEDTMEEMKLQPFVWCLWLGRSFKFRLLLQEGLPQEDKC